MRLPNLDGSVATFTTNVLSGLICHVVLNWPWNRSPVRSESLKPEPMSSCQYWKEEANQALFFTSGPVNETSCHCWVSGRGLLLFIGSPSLSALATSSSNPFTL